MRILFQKSPATHIATTQCEEFRFILHERPLREEGFKDEHQY